MVARKTIEPGDARLGEQMSQFRDARGAKQKDVASAMKVHEDKLRRFEKGDQMPTLRELQRFGEVLVLSVGEKDELFRLAEVAVRGEMGQRTEAATEQMPILWRPEDEQQFVEVLTTAPKLQLVPCA